MHPSAMLNGRLFFDTYIVPMGEVVVADVGAQDVNGSLRDACPPGVSYIGIDFEQAKGVDVVLTDPYSIPLESESVDAVVSSSCFEHSEMYWLVFQEILRILRPHGLLYLNVPSNGVFHRYPVDCWRFYPDAGSALVTWARRCGINAALLESYISRRDVETWNDFVAVFLKDEGLIGRHPRRILSSLKDFENGKLHGQKDILNPAIWPEEQRLVSELQRRNDLLSRNLDHMASAVLSAAGELTECVNTTPASSEPNQNLRNRLGLIRDRLLTIHNSVHG